MGWNTNLRQAKLEQLAEVPLEVLDALWTIYEYGFMKGASLKAKAWLDGYDACADGQERRYVEGYDHKKVA